MEDVSTQVHERLKNLLSDWKSASAIGVAVLYVLGYLSLRFHMTAIGISTELALLDERYLFAGARVLIYLGLSTCVSGVCRNIARPTSIFSQVHIFSGDAVTIRMERTRRSLKSQDNSSPWAHCIHCHDSVRDGEVI